MKLTKPVLSNELSSFLEDHLLKNTYEERISQGFPTESLINEYLTHIDTFSELEVRSLLYQLVPKQLSLNLDNVYMNYYKAKKESPYTTLEEQAISGRRIEDTQYYKRLMSPSCDTWEGMTWALDLLPHFPSEAIKALDAYFLANCAFMPDAWFGALTDCIAIIRTRYLQKNHPRELLLQLSPTDFELLTASLYSKMGYKTKLTKQTRDGGIDIYANKETATHKEKLIIQCKKYTPKITFEEITKILGVFSSKTTKATKVVLVTSSLFTPDATKFAKRNPSIELINYKSLIHLLNEYHGPYWPNKIDRILLESKQEHKQMPHLTRT